MKNWNNLRTINLKQANQISLWTKVKKISLKNKKNKLAKATWMRHSKIYRKSTKAKSILSKKAVSKTLTSKIQPKSTRKSKQSNYKRTNNPH